MKSIKNKTKNITINGEAINTTSNSINYKMVISVEDFVAAIAIFPNINGSTTFDGTNFIYSSCAYITNLPDIMSNNKVETSDVGLSGTELTLNFATSILFLTNCLELNLDEWELI